MYRVTQKIFRLSIKAQNFCPDQYLIEIFCMRLVQLSLKKVTRNWAEKAKPERSQCKKPEWNKAESVRPKEQARIIIPRIGLRQNASSEQG
jgi:hypothetical protein